MYEWIYVIVFFSVYVTFFPAHSGISIKADFLSLKIIAKWSGCKRIMKAVIVIVRARVTQPVDMVTAVYSEHSRMLLTDMLTQVCVNTIIIGILTSVADYFRWVRGGVWQIVVAVRVIETRWDVKRKPLRQREKERTLICDGITAVRIAPVESVVSFIARLICETTSLVIGRNAWMGKSESVAYLDFFRCVCSPKSDWILALFIMRPVKRFCTGQLVISPILVFERVDTFYGITSMMVVPMAGSYIQVVSHFLIWELRENVVAGWKSHKDVFICGQFCVATVGVFMNNDVDYTLRTSKTRIARKFKILDFPDIRHTHTFHFFLWRFEIIYKDCHVASCIVGNCIADRIYLKLRYSHLP